MSDTMEGIARPSSDHMPEDLSSKLEVKPTVQGSDEGYLKPSIAQSERGLQNVPEPSVKKEPADVNTPSSAMQSPTVLPTTEGKKRPAPRSHKKGTAVIRKPSMKKRKIETQSKDGTPFSQRSATPTSSRTSKTPAPKNRKRLSVTPGQSSPPRSEGDAEDDDGDDDSALFCVCRKPDDHGWMIGCDGGCEDWFHGKCVKMNADDAELVDKFICPNCAQKGASITTWKPMCRLDGCRVPARVSPPNPSKYCCDEHGEEFMRRRVFNKAKPQTKKKRINEMDDYDSQAYLRGGLLRPGELKTLATGSKDITEFRKLGESVLDSNAASDLGGKSDHGPGGSDVIGSTPEERARLEEIRSKESQWNHKLEALNDKEKLLGMVKARATLVLSELNQKSVVVVGKKKETIKDICGFDSRLSWSDEEFDAWRASDAGSTALQTNLLSAPTTEVPAIDGEGDVSMANGNDNGSEEIGGGVCQKKRCERHKAWYKLQQQELGFERDECRQQLRKLDREAKGIGERYMLKKLESEATADTVGGATGADTATVEAV